MKAPAKPSRGNWIAPVPARSWVAPLLVLVLLVVAYLPSLQGGFIWDDDEYVSRNVTLTTLSGLGRIWFDPAASPQYYPLVFTTYWIEHHLWGLAPFGYKLVNLALHAASAWVLWRLLAGLRIPGAGVTAALFALHPVAMESVAWITERKNCLSMLFYLLAAGWWLKWRGSLAARSADAGTGPASSRAEGASSRSEGASSPGTDADRGAPAGRETPFRRTSRSVNILYIAALVAFVLALLSKTVTATLPAALLLVRWWQTGRVERRDVVSLLPFFVLGAGLGLHTAWLEKHHVGAQGEEWALSFLDRILLASRIPWFYAVKILIPYPIAFIYPRWTIDAASAGQWSFPLLTAATLAALVYFKNKIGRGPLAAVLFFLGTLTPALGFFDVFPMRYSWVADHFQYHAMIGVLVLIGAGLARGVASLGTPPPRLALAATVPVLIYAGLVFGRGPAYRDLESLWLDTVAKNPGAWMAHHNLAQVYEDQGRTNEALQRYATALGIKEELPNTHYNLGSLLAKGGRSQEALPHLERAVALDASLPGAVSNLANTYLVLGRSNEAIARYKEVLAEEPSNGTARRNLAFALASVGDAAGAVREYRSILEAEPGDVRTAARLAWILATAKDPAVRNGVDAQRIAEDALQRTEPPDPLLLQVLAAARAENGRFQDAMELIGRAIALARSANQVERVQTLEAQLELYRTGQALRAE